MLGWNWIMLCIAESRISIIQKRASLKNLLKEKNVNYSCKIIHIDFTDFTSHKSILHCSLICSVLE